MLLKASREILLADVVGLKTFASSEAWMFPKDSCCQGSSGVTDVQGQIDFRVPPREGLPCSAECSWCWAEGLASGRLLAHTLLVLSFFPSPRHFKLSLLQNQTQQSPSYPRLSMLILPGSHFSEWSPTSNEPCQKPGWSSPTCAHSPCITQPYLSTASQISPALISTAAPWVQATILWPLDDSRAFSLASLCPPRTFFNTSKGIF